MVPKAVHFHVDRSAYLLTMASKLSGSLLGNQISLCPINEVQKSYELARSPEVSIPEYSEGSLGGRTKSKIEYGLVLKIDIAYPI